jgi:hypothetical protein
VVIIEEIYEIVGNFGENPVFITENRVLNGKS